MFSFFPFLYVFSDRVTSRSNLLWVLIRAIGELCYLTEILSHCYFRIAMCFERWIAMIMQTEMFLTCHYT